MKKKLYLQMFAEGIASTGEGEGNTGGEGAGTGEGEGAKGKEPQKKTYTDDEVNAIIDRKFAEWQKKQDKTVAEAKKLAEMNAQEKAEYKAQQLEKELAELKKQNSLSEMTKTARKMLSEQGINISDELLSMMVSTEAEDTKEAVDGFTKLFKEAVETAVKERLKGEPPKKGTGGAPTNMTKEQIMNIKDPELRQKKMLENKHLFNF